MQSLVQYFNENSLEKNILLIIAISSTILFLIRMFAIMLGGHVHMHHGGAAHGHGGIFHNHGATVNHGGTDVHHDDCKNNGAAFQLLTYQSVLAFLMTFGWATLASRFDYNQSMVVSLIVGAALGVGAMFFSSWLMLMTSKLNQEPVAAPKVQVGIEASTYVTIPANEATGGVITVVADGRLQELPAKTKGESIPAFAKVKVVQVEPYILVELVK